MEVKLERIEGENICLGSHLLAYLLLNKLGESLPMFCSLVAGGGVLWSNCRKHGVRFSLQPPGKPEFYPLGRKITVEEKRLKPPCLHRTCYQCSSIIPFNDEAVKKKKIT